MGGWYIGVLLEILGSFLSTLGKEFFRLAAIRIAAAGPASGAPSDHTLLPKSAEGSSGSGSSKAFCREAPPWLLYATGVTCAVLVYPALETIAYSYTAQSILAACAGL